MSAPKAKLSTIVPVLTHDDRDLFTGEDVLHDPNFDEGLEDTSADIDALDAAYLGLTPEGEAVALRLGPKAGSNELLSREERQAELAAAEAAFQQRLRTLAPKPVGAPKYGPEAPLTRITVPNSADASKADDTRTEVQLDLAALQAAHLAYERHYQALVADLITLSEQRFAAEQVLTTLLTYYRPLLSTHYGELFATLMVCAPKVLFYALRFSEFRYYYLGEHNYIQEYQLFDKLLSEDRRFYAKLNFYRSQRAEFFAQGLSAKLEQNESDLKPTDAQELLAQYQKMDKRTAQARFLREKLKAAGLLPHKGERVRPKRKVRMKTTDDYELIMRAQERERLLASGQPLPPELLADLLEGDLSHPETGTIGVHSFLAAEKSKQAQAQKEQAQYFNPVDDETHEPISLEQKMRAALERHNADVANNFGLGPDAEFKSPFFGSGKARYEQDLEQAMVRSLYNYVTHDELEQALKQGMELPEVERPVITAENINPIIALMRHLARVRSYGPIDARRYHPAGQDERRHYQITRPYTFDARRQIEDLASVLERNEFSQRHSLLTLLANTVRLKELFGEAHKSYDLAPYQGQGWFRLEEASRLCLIVYMGKNVTIRAAQGSQDHAIELKAADVWQRCLYLEGLEFTVAGTNPNQNKSSNHLSGALKGYEGTGSAASKRKRLKPGRPNMITPQMIDPNELCYILL